MRRESKKAASSAFYIVLSVALLWRFYFIGNLVPFRRGLRISALPIPTEKQSLRQTLEKTVRDIFRLHKVSGYLPGNVGEYRKSGQRIGTGRG